MKLKKKQKQQLIKFAILFAVVILALLFGIISKEDIIAAISENLVENKTENNTKTAEKPIENPSNETYEVLKVVDGDTIQIDFNGTKEKVRLIGIDTPESVHPDEAKNTENGKIASEYTKSILTGKRVKLELDVQERDKYGRILAYVYLDGQMVNKKLLADGYAQVATFPPNVKYVEEFKEIQKEAKEAKRGLWGEWNKTGKVS